MAQADVDAMRVGIARGCEAVAKSEAVRMLRGGKAKPMHMYFPPAYVPTDHVRWLATTYARHPHASCLMPIPNTSR
jgi:hypothetical protein